MRFGLTRFTSLSPGCQRLPTLHTATALTEPGKDCCVWREPVFPARVHAGISHSYPDAHIQTLSTHVCHTYTAEPLLNA